MEFRDVPNEIKMRFAYPDYLLCDKSLFYICRLKIC